MRLQPTTLVMILVCCATYASSYGAERKPIEEVDRNTLVRETQTSADCERNHINIVWCVPHEFWQMAFSNAPDAGNARQEELLKTLKPYCLVAIVQADVSALGTFRFYGKEEIARNLELSMKKEDGRSKTLTPIENLDTDVKLVIDTMTPTLSAAMGEMGKNMHFYVIKDADSSGKRVVDPCEDGTFNVTLGTRSGKTLQASIEFPLNSLFVPRKCPNGKDAQVSWKYCPWTGKKLPE